MTPKLFLKIAGGFLITIGILGLIGIFGKISSVGFFHPPYWINFVHLVIGIIALIASFKFNKKHQAMLVLIPAVLATTIGVLGLLFGPYVSNIYKIPELKDPSDHIAHLTVGLLAIWAIFKK